MKQEILDALLAARAAKRPVASVTHLESGDQALVYRDETSSGKIGALALDDAAIASARRAIADDKSTRIDNDAGALFIQVSNPPKRMIIVGAVHIAQPLVEIARTAGYALTIVDPRGAFATRDRFPGVELSEDWPDDALKALAIDTRTAVVTLTHDPKLDDPALHVALRSDAFYIGSLGSKKTHGTRVTRLAQEGYSETEIARIHAPIGLNIGGKSPAEIAISIMAQVTEVLHKQG
ncbi:MAG: xanthine dehydrogenase accessory factor [Alphaproteobacteria bacterium]|jgi:xanthine dehydrogenase accessory factor